MRYGILTYQNYGAVKNRMKHGRRFVQALVALPELNVRKGDMFEVHDYSAKEQTFYIFTAYGDIKIWSSKVKAIA